MKDYTKIEIVKNPNESKWAEEFKPLVDELVEQCRLYGSVELIEGSTKLGTISLDAEGNCVFDWLPNAFKLPTKGEL